MPEVEGAGREAVVEANDKNRVSNSVRKKCR